MKILVFQHVDVETPGILLDFFREDGFQWTTVELDQGEAIPPLEPFDLMVVMGGPQDVWQEDQFPWLRPEKAAIRDFVLGLNRPYLGICLGHQLLAEATGGSVGPAKVPEIGVLPITRTEAGGRDSVIKALPNPTYALQWHGAEVTALPPEGEALAKSDVCRVEALRVGRAYGFQYHVEIHGGTVRQWADIPEYASALEQAMGKDGVARLQRDVAERLPQFNKDARTLYEGFKATLTA